MKIITVLIGNSDNRLPQQAWSNFVDDVLIEVDMFATEVYFFGAPPNYEMWQNVAFVFAIEDAQAKSLKEILTEIRVKYKQDSVAWTEGKTQFI